MNLIALIFLFVLLILGVTHPSWMPALYAYLDQSQPPEAADMIVVLAGSEFRRLDAALELYANGFSDRFLITGTSSNTSDTAEKLRRLANANVQPSHIWIDESVTSTFDEALAALRVLRRESFDSAIIVTDAPHMRRARAVYTALANDDPLKLTFVATKSSITPDRWWHNAEIFRFVLSEYSKMVYYALRYGIRAF